MRRLALLLILVGSSLAPAADWPQWLGPTRDGVWPETGILDQFPPDGPKKLWSVPVGGGYSSPAVVDGKVYVSDYQKASGEAFNNPGKVAELTGTERVLCLDAKTGQSVWEHSYPCEYKVSYPAGPRATPTVSGGKVYAVGAMGNLVCCDAATGKLVWQKDYKTDYQAKTPIWGFAGHPLVYHELLICVVGDPAPPPDANAPPVGGHTVVAFNKDTGAEVWRKLSAPEPGYSAPMLITAGGVEQLVVWTSKAINSLNPKTGEKYWSHPLEPNYGMAIMMPRMDGNILYAGGIGNKGVALKLDSEKPAATELYVGTNSTAVYPVNSTPLVVDGTLYGVDQPGQLRAVNLATGKRLWETFKPVVGADLEPDARVGSGTAYLVKNQDKFFLFGENGDLVIARLTPEKYTELSRANLVAPTGEAFGRKVAWAMPAFADKCVFVRTDAELACFSLAKE